MFCGDYMKFIKKKWFIFFIIILTIIRFLISYKLPIFYINNLGYDDDLMIRELESLLSGNYLGTYNNLILTKGIIYPLFMAITKLCSLNYNIILTIFYILSCVFFSKSLENIIKSRKYILIIYIILLFNPISYSSELFQRLYRNSLSIIELLLFFSFVIRIISNKKNIFDYYYLGLITSIMFLTREDNIWTLIIFLILFIYKIYKDKKVKSILINLIPFCTLIINLNIVSYINYKYYGVYTYNELLNSNFKNCYIKILEIKDEHKIDKVSLYKDNLYKLSDISSKFDITKDSIDNFYEKAKDGNGEINNGNAIWYLRNLFYIRYQFLKGDEANKYFKELSDEIEYLFKTGKLEKEFAIPSTLINTPTLNDIKELPINIIKAVKYISTYQNVKSYAESELLQLSKIQYNNDLLAYQIEFDDYNSTENIIQNNIEFIEIIRIIYKYFTIIFSIIGIFIFIRNIKLRDKINLLITITLITYLIILFGVVYTHTTSFYAIRYFYLGNIYILQSIFILLNMHRIYREVYNKINDFFKCRKARKNV